MDTIEQGEIYSFEIECNDTTGLTGEINVMQYPGDTPALTKALTVDSGVFKGTITSAESAALAIGQWFIHSKIIGTGEDIREPIKLYISKGWV